MNTIRIKVIEKTKKQKTKQKKQKQQKQREPLLGGCRNVMLRFGQSSNKTKFVSFLFIISLETKNETENILFGAYNCLIVTRWSIFFNILLQVEFSRLDVCVLPSHTLGKCFFLKMMTVTVFYRSAFLLFMVLSDISGQRNRAPFRISE